MPFTEPKRWLEPPHEPSAYEAAMRYLRRDLPPGIAEQVRVDNPPNLGLKRRYDGELYIFDRERDEFALTVNEPLPSPDVGYSTKDYTFKHEPFEYPANVWWLMSFSIEMMRVVVIGPLDERWPPEPPRSPRP